MKVPVSQTSLHQRITLLLQAILLGEVLIAVWNQQWMSALVASAIILVTLSPFFINKFFRVFIPPEFVLLAVLFVFASLFLGEVRGYYTRFWWWDLVLHTGSGFLLGVLGFLLVHIMNETEKIDVHMKPGFVAFFSFVFAVAVGAVWEIFEYSMDVFFGLNMQKEMLGDDSGLTDTMWDLIVDSIGALVIAVLGYSYLKTSKNESFLIKWMHSFIKNNPRLFKPRQ
ncbi:MAG: hypothetical protein HUJ29_03075 [Gammaproteobacteria bacterium]|nr:hypothetical protein [Gammaproteobacteria bacterium]